jgi:hypothetical protein
MVCCATVNVVSSAPTSLTYNSPQPLHLTAQSSSSSILSPPKSTLFCRTFSPLSPTFRSNHPLSASDQEVSFQAPSSPGLVRLSVTVSQRDVSCSAEALITVTDSLDAAVGPSLFNARGIPGYTFERAAGELWRSRFDAERNLIVVNNGHRDFVFATRSRTLQLRHLVRLYVKELVLKNFRGLPAERLMERLIELSLYVEEKLKTA